MEGGARLRGATSPYLLQHADNPVAWFPWGNEAFEEARRRDVPVFLSVGYSACHWCHVMERESFEDEATAAFLNDNFVAVKVDREERPDIDAIYMTAVQAMTGQGGWPMSVFLTPAGEPFWAATYLPDQPRHGMPSFRQVLEGLAAAWRERRGEIVEQGASVTSAIERATVADASDGGKPPSPAAALQRLAHSFDERWGGFGGAPKFPQAPVLEWLLRRAVRGDDDAERMVVRTLDAIADGGIHDHVTGGFARYSTDAAWHVPHFEKMLYDNAQLLTLYTRAWLHSRHERFRDVASMTGTALLDTFRLPDGGFASSIDADSGGREGAFATWSWEGLAGLVGPAVAEAYGATPEGNWEGTNVLWRPRPLMDIATSYGLDIHDLELQVRGARTTLASARAERVQPSMDDKVVAGWNGLAIIGLTTAGRAFGDPTFIDAALRCGEFIWDQMRVAGRLQRAWRDGRLSGPAFLDDHALVGLGMLALFETTADVRWFDRAQQLAGAITELFWNDDRLHQTGSDAETLVVRPRERTDDVTPGGPSAATELFVRLSHLTGDAGQDARARAITDKAGALPEQAPQGFGHLWCVLDMLEGPFREVAIVGDPDDGATRGLIDEIVSARYLPNVQLAVSAPDGPAIRHVPLLNARSLVGGRPAAYVCERFTCRLPVTTPEALAAEL